MSLQNSGLTPHLRGLGLRVPLLVGVLIENGGCEGVLLCLHAENRRFMMS